MHMDETALLRPTKLGYAAIHSLPLLNVIFGRGSVRVREAIVEQVV